MGRIIGRFPRALLAVLSVGMVLAACTARPSGIVHTVKPGENLFRIGKAYGIDYRELARRNDIPDPSVIYAGQRIFVPGADRRLPVEVITPRSVETRGDPMPPPASDGRFVWPVASGLLTSRFGARGDSVHDGIDIAAPHGTPVYAAQAGRVVYSDRIRGYGNVVIVAHAEGWATVYAHNARNLVSEGVNVRRGQVIAEVGATGRATGPNLHFEVRHRNVARDPLRYLPASDTVRRTSLE